MQLTFSQDEPEICNQKLSVLYSWFLITTREMK
jgi:hypothetical protein